MKKIATKIHDAWLVKPEVYRDERGFFLESWNKDRYQEIGIDFDFVQDNQSRSGQYVLRGLHYQAGDSAQGKLVWVTAGTVFDAIVDLRRSSPTFGCWDGYMLTADAHERLWVPRGCAHGYLVLSEHADFFYKCTHPYSVQNERMLRWDDAGLAIEWPIPEGVLPKLSAKDACAPTFEECEKYA